MSEEMEEVEELSAQEVMEQHKAEIEERFEEKGFFRRLGDMFAGFKCPRDSREYKAALIELQRLKAPIIAALIPVVGVIVLIVVTAVQGQQKDVIQVDLAQAVEDPEELREDEPEPEMEPPDPPEDMPDIQVDVPVVGPVTDMISNAPPSNEPVSVKPAPMDAVAIIKSPVTMRSMVGSRTPGQIGQMTRGGAGYGDASTEAAVLKVLRWLKHTQAYDGHWDPSPVSNTALAVLCYLAHGETPSSKEFGPTVENAMQYLINCLEGDGDNVKFKGSDRVEYAFLIATYALCETYGMTRNPNAKEAAEKALTRIVNSQSSTGGWDYNMVKSSNRDDLSYAGWALQALKAGKMAGLHPYGLDECIKKAIHCLQTRNFKNGGFNYTAGGSPTGLTATGCLCMQLLGYGNRAEVKEALDFMREWTPTWEPIDNQAKKGGKTPGHNPQYYCYYAAQCKYQAGMKQGAKPEDVKTWQDWNLAMKALYPKSIITLPEKIKDQDGKEHAMGYFKRVKDPTCAPGGDVMSSCLAALQLMVYYRYLPTTQTKAGQADDDPEPANNKKADADVKVDVDI